MLTTAQAAEKLGTSPRRVLALIQAERLAAAPFGPTYMIQEQDLALVKNRKPGRPRSTSRKASSRKRS